ncbi:MAG: pentapeptide repeat-containing protein, partial [Acetatifactor sp.]|nr:pentapeptide repeat-containing protein [Acetatifactor sp.]
MKERGTMNELQLYKQNEFVEFKKFESRNLSYSVFENIDFHKFMHFVSFFRSDFRGTKFTNIQFYKNNFDRSDFLNAVFIDCSFEKVQFGCCQMKNCYFKNVKFSNNLYRNTSIHSTTFVNCEFPDETFLINMQHCTLKNCTFNGCTFEMSTTDSDTFDSCSFCNTNLATMHAENHKFVKCQLNNVCIDSSYFFGYSIADCMWNQVTFLYRGDYVHFKDILVEDFLNTFETQHRYNDIINFYISKKVQEKIPDILKMSFYYYKELPYGRMSDISIIIESLIFAAIYETVDYDILNEAITIIADADMSNYSFDEQIEIDALCTKLQNALYLRPHSEKYLAKIAVNSISTLS